MIKRILGALTAIAAAGVLGACGYQHQANALAPTSTATATSSPTGTSSAASFTGTWTSLAVTAPSPSSCTNFQWHVTNQTATSIQGDFSADCPDGLSITGSASGQLASPTSVPVTVTGTASMPGIPSCSFSLSGTGTVEDNATALFIPYSGTTCLGPVHGAETLRKKSPAAPAPAPTPTPAPTPVPTPVPTPGPVSSDGINLSTATIMNSPSDVANWPATARLTLLDLGVGGAHVEFTKKDGPGSWPDVRPPGWSGDLQYTLWIVLNVNGRWYASGCIEYWRGLDRNGGPPSQYAQNWYYDPIRWGAMSGHQPAPGEQVGFFVTAGDARNNGTSILHERSNIVVVPFPGAGGGVFGF
jgi:hypothetical protein